jgi:2-desacetyl-2-hydroxyethyl bacteriochlorophyllide A dehydrogenase
LISAKKIWPAISVLKRKKKIMKAMKIYGPNEIRIETVPEPSVEHDEILVKVYACGICGSDLHTYKSGAVSKSRTPVIPGHEFSGEIVEVGSSVKGLTIGTKVFGYGVRTCGACYWCQRGTPARCSDIAVPGWGLDGAFAEYVRVPNPRPGKNLFSIPDGMGWSEATTFEPLSVACSSVQKALLQPEDVVVIMGAGVIGQGLAQAAKASAAKVIVCEPSRKRREMAEKLGADLVLNPRETDPVQAIEEATSKDMASVVFECSGASVGFQQSMALLRPMGKMMQVAVFERDVLLNPDLINSITFKNLTIQGCAGANWSMALDFVLKGRVKMSELITHEFSLDEAKEAFETQLDAEKSIKVVIRPFE